MANLVSQTLRPTLLLTVFFLAIIPSNVEPFYLDAMTSSLLSSGFTLFMHALHAQNLTPTATATTHQTYFAPPDTALINHHLGGDSLRSHVSAAGAFSYQSLLTLPPNSTLPTLHENTTLVVGTDGQRVSFNDVLVVLPNLYVDKSCVVHGVDRPLVPIPLPAHDFPKARTETKRSPSVPRRQLVTYSHFIRRRANHPHHVDEKDHNFGLP